MVVAGHSMEAKSTRTRQPPADGARSHCVGVRVWQRVPSLTHADQAIPRYQQTNGLVVESHPPQVGSARDPTEDRRLPLESHSPSLTVPDPGRSRSARLGQMRMPMRHLCRTTPSRRSNQQRLLRCPDHPTTLADGFALSATPENKDGDRPHPKQERGPTTPENKTRTGVDHTRKQERSSTTPENKNGGRPRPQTRTEINHARKQERGSTTPENKNGGRPRPKTRTEINHPLKTRRGINHAWNRESARISSARRCPWVQESYGPEGYASFASGTSRTVTRVEEPERWLIAGRTAGSRARQVRR